MTTSLFLLPQDHPLLQFLFCICLRSGKLVARSFSPLQISGPPNKLWRTRRTDRVYHSPLSKVKFALSYQPTRRRPRFGHYSTYTRPSGHFIPRLLLDLAEPSPPAARHSHQLFVRARDSTHSGDFTIRRSYCPHRPFRIHSIAPSRPWTYHLPAPSGTIELKIRSPQK